MPAKEVLNRIGPIYKCHKDKVTGFPSDATYARFPEYSRVEAMAIVRPMVRIKPLVWMRFGERKIRALSFSKMEYVIEKCTLTHWEAWLLPSDIYRGFDGVFSHNTLRSAKRACQVDHEQRILLALSAGEELHQPQEGA